MFMITAQFKKFFRRWASIILSFTLQRQRSIVLVLAVFLFLFALTLYRAGYLSAPAILELVQRYPILAPGLFIILYAALILLFLPTLPLNLAAGFLWGVGWGSVITVVASGLGGAGCFLLARYLGFDFLRQRVPDSFWRLLDRFLGGRDWQIVAFTRLNPIFPFGLISYAYGLTAVDFFRYLGATIIFVLPLTVFFASLGQLLGGVALAGDAAMLVRELLLSSLILITAAVFWGIMRSRVSIRREQLK